jgi:hypothetical protein
VVLVAEVPVEMLERVLVVEQTQVVELEEVDLQDPEVLVDLV